MYLGSILPTSSAIRLPYENQCIELFGTLGAREFSRWQDSQRIVQLNRKNHERFE